MALVDVELSEPYSVFTYRYFINNWRHLCFLVRRDAQAPERGPDEGFQAFVDERCVGAVVCKLDAHRGTRRGYLAMLVVEKEYRKLRIGAPLEAAQATPASPLGVQARSWSVARWSLWRATALRRCALALCCPAVRRSRLAQVVLEAETTNLGALRLYSRAGFLRDKRLGKYYLSGADAYRLKLLLPQASDDGDES